MPVRTLSSINMLKNITKYFLVITVFAIPFYFWRFNIGPIPTTVLEVLIYITFILALSSGYLKGLVKGNRLAFYLGLLFVAAGLVSALVDPDKMAGLGLFKAYFFDGFLLFCLVLRASEEKEILKESFVVGAATAAALALVYFFLGIHTGDNRLYDLAQISPNYMAMLLSPVVILALAISFKNWKANWPYFFCLPVLLIALYFTFSRGAIIAVAAGLLTLFFGKMIIAGKRFARSALVALMVLLLAGAYFVYKPDWTDHARKATSSNVRYYIWTTSLEIIGKNPVVGVGLSNYQNYFTNLTQDRVNFPEFISPVALTAHNLFLQVYAVGGIILFIAFIALILGSRFWSLNDLGASAAMITILVYALVDTPFFRNDLACEAWLILALLYLAYEKKLQRS